MIDQIVDQELRLEIAGNITAGLLKDLAATVRTKIDCENSYCVIKLDLSKTREIDSMGLTFIVSLYKTAQQKGKQFKVIGLSEEIHSLFQLIRLDREFQAESLKS